MDPQFVRILLRKRRRLIVVPNMTAAALATRVATRDVCVWSTAYSTLLLLLLAVALIIVTGYSISS